MSEPTEAQRKEFKSIEEFEEHYLPEYCKKYPIKMRVSQEEADYIKLRFRGGWEDIKKIKEQLEKSNE